LALFLGSVIVAALCMVYYALREKEYDMLIFPILLFIGLLFLASVILMACGI